MTMTLGQAKEAIYQSLAHENHDIDRHIGHLKAALAVAGQKAFHVEPARLAQNNRQGRKMMQSYFKKRGVTVVFGQ